MAEINGWRGLQNLAERKTGRIVVSVAERWRCCSKPVTGHLWLLVFRAGEIWVLANEPDLELGAYPRTKLEN